MLKKQTISYHDQDQTLEAYCVFEENNPNQRPVILVAHDWSGKNNFACEKANQLAELGYVGFAIDMYGNGKQGETNEEKSKLIQPFMEDRHLLQKRILAALDAAKNIPEVNTAKIGAIGFCFGGLCVLDLARSGADIAGVVSFHGLLNAPEKLPRHLIKAKILALHGYADPMVPPDLLLKFAAEMTAAEADWQIHAYGNTLHAFTNPKADDLDFGTVYNAKADRRSWMAMKNFFDEIFD